MDEPIIMLPLTSIIELTNIPDRPLNPSHVANLVATNEPAQWKPIIVTPVGDKYGRIAGRHRIEAAKQLHCNALRAVVRSYPSNADMYIAMWEDNVRNGLPLSTKERKEYAVSLSALYPGLALREIGRRTGLPHQTVKAALEQAKGTDKPGGLNEDIKRLKGLCRKLRSVSNAFLDFTEDFNLDESAEILAGTLMNSCTDTSELEDIENTFIIMAGVFEETSKRIQAGRAA